MGANPHANGGVLLRDLQLPDFRDYAIAVPEPGQGHGRRYADARPVPARRDQAQRRPAQLPHLWARRNGLQPLDRRFRGHRQAVGSGGRADRRSSRHGGPRGRDVERASMRRVAGRLPADRPPWAFQYLRGVRPYHRLDVQPAREMVEGHPAHPLAAADRLAQYPPGLARLAAGSQWFHPSRSWLHRPCVQQEGRDHPRLSAAGHEHVALGRRSLLAQPATT